MTNWKLEDNVNDWVKSEFARISQTKYTVESAMSVYLKNAIQIGVKLKRLELEEAGEKEKGKSWKPDFELEDFNIPVLIEDKLGFNKLIVSSGEKVKLDIKSVKNFAVNGAIHYAQCAIMGKKYSEVIAIGIAGDNVTNVKIKVYYVFGSTDETYKLIDTYTTLDFLESKKSFAEFYKSVKLTEDEKHKILIDSQAKLQEYAKKLNKLMHNHAITAPQRVLYVSGMLLAMQDIEDKINGLTPNDLKGVDLDNQRDGDTIVRHIENYLKGNKIPQDKINLMMSSFKEINKDIDRDKKIELDTIIGKLLPDLASVNKQIFTYIYENIFLSIDSMSGHLDIMGEMYSEFLKYALGDGKEIGIVLTPPYITKMMTQILEVDENSKVMDLATGSAGFLISSMELMIDYAEQKHGKRTDKADEKIEQIKKHQLLGVELNAEMFTLASTNMILRGDGSSNIRKGSSFNEPLELYKEFNADKLLLNPPFSFEENGMPFIRFGLENMKIGGKAAIIIQDSAGSGKGVKSCKSILSQNQLLASIKMPIDLFIPMAGVQTSIYIIEHTGKTHDYKKQVKFIDFRNDGYKRTKRSLIEIDNPMQRYNDIIEIYKNGATADVSPTLWNLKQTVVMSVISNNGNDWNFDHYQKIDTKPTIKDFKKTIGDYLAWELSNLLTQKIENKSFMAELEAERIAELEVYLSAPNLKNYILTDEEKQIFEMFEKGEVKFEEFEIQTIFDVSPSKAYAMNDRDILIENGKTPYVSNQSQNNGYIGWSNLKALNPSNVITLSDTWQSERTIFYQDTEFIGKSHLQVMKAYDTKFQKLELFFAISSFRKAILELNYDYGTKFNRKKIKTTKIQLPTNNGKIDYALMGTFISAIQKLVIKDVVLYANRKIDSTKSVALY
jgi:type I restriction enzyme M protein